MRFPLVLLFTLWPLAVAANDCDGRAPAIIRAAWPDAQPAGDEITIEGRRVSLSDSDPHRVFCRRWPAHPQLLLAAVPMIRPEGTAQEYDRQGDLEVLVLDATSLAPQARLRLADFILEDAIMLAGLGFDTAPYRLFGDRLAFGIRRELAGESRPNPYGQTDLTLFDLQGDRLRPVLLGLVVTQSKGEWDMDCTGSFETLTRVLDLAPNAQAADLVVRGTVQHRTNRAEGGACVSAETTETLAPFTLQYDGNIYPLPESPPPAAR